MSALDISVWILCENKVYDTLIYTYLIAILLSHLKQLRLVYTLRTQHKNSTQNGEPAFLCQIMNCGAAHIGFLRNTIVYS